MAAEQKPTPEREQTDESLRAEREKADAAIGSPASKVEVHPAVENARDRADDTVAAVRATTDVALANAPVIVPSPELIDRERQLEDEALRRERAEADEALRRERAMYAALLERERAETDRDLSRERLRSDQALAARDEFLGIVSHDLRNMLGTVVGFAALISKEQEQDNEPARIRSYIQRIQRAGGRMDRLIGDLVDLASIHAGSLAVKRERTDAAAVVTEAVEAFQPQARAKEVALVPSIAPRLPLVPLDAARAHQVLINLISNAIKFTPKGGRVSVEVAAVGSELSIVVRDTGVGIPHDKLESVFERFVQVTEDRRGVGLGLYISRCIVLGHGGTIIAESAVGKGSTFTIKLPLETK